MGRPIPEVVEGYRGPRDETRTKAPSHPARGIPEGKTVFQFTHDRYRLQLTAPVDDRLPDGRILRGKKAAVVSAEDGFAVLDNIKDSETIKLVKAHDYYGQDFWDYATVLEAQQERKRQDVVKVLQDPDDRAAILKALADMGVTADDFVIPEKKEAKKSA